MGEGESMLSVHISEFAGQGPLQPMLPDHIMAIKNTIQWMDFEKTIANLPLTQHKTLSMGVISAAGGDISTNIKLDGISQVYSSLEIIGYVERNASEGRFEFHVIPAQSQMVSRLLKNICHEKCSRFPEPSKLLLLVVHSDEYVPPRNWIDETLSVQKFRRHFGEIGEFQHSNPSKTIAPFTYCRSSMRIESVQLRKPTLLMSKAVIALLDSVLDVLPGPVPRLD